MSWTRSWTPFAIVACVGVMTLLVLGFGGRRSRAFALGAPNQQTVAVLPPHGRACEGPITPAQSLAAVRTWGASVDAPSAIGVLLTSGSGSVLASGRVGLTSTPSAYTATLGRTVSPAQALTVCLIDQGRAPISLLGSPSVDAAVRMTVQGRPSPLQFSLVALRPDRPLLSLLPTAFSRAALFRPGGVGSWTFWLLLAAVLLTVPIAGSAISAAARADERDS
jgi:hypothetical protein